MTFLTFTLRYTFDDVGLCECSPFYYYEKSFASSLKLYNYYRKNNFLRKEKNKKLTFPIQIKL